MRIQVNNMEKIEEVMASNKPCCDPPPPMVNGINGGSHHHDSDDGSEFQRSPIGDRATAMATKSLTAVRTNGHYSDDVESRLQQLSMQQCSLGGSGGSPHYNGRTMQSVPCVTMVTPPSTPPPPPPLLINGDSHHPRILSSSSAPHHKAAELCLKLPGGSRNSISEEEEEEMVDGVEEEQLRTSGEVTTAETETSKVMASKAFCKDKLPPPKESLLLRLFESKLLDASIAITHLYKSKEPGVQTYIGGSHFYYKVLFTIFYWKMERV